jgi:hypothetical protein
MEDRLDNPEAYQQKKMEYYQRAWSGKEFENQDWAKLHGDGKNRDWGKQ